MLDRRSWKKWRYRSAMLAGALVFWAAVRLIRAHSPGPYSPRWPMVALMTTATIALACYSLVFARFIWRTRDEFEKSGRLHSYYWGGAFGLMAAVTFLTFVQFGGVSLLFPSITFDHNLMGVFSAGFMCPIIFQLLGFLISYTLWRRAR